MIIKTSYPFMKPPPSARLIRGHRSAQGLVGLWTMAENGGLQVFDLSGNNNTGTFQGTAPSWSAGKFGSAVLFPGTDEAIDCGNSSTLNPPEITGIVWFNANSFSNWQYVLHRIDDSSFDPYRLELGATNAYIAVGDRVQSKNISASANHNASTGEWHQLGFTFANGLVCLYFDGILLNSNTDVTITMQPGNISTKIADGALGSFFDGLIDNVSIYNRALSAGEIAELYREPFCMFERRARTALMSGYEVGVPPTTFPYYYREIASRRIA